ncbi:biotin transporter BioY [Staphylococcus massiliensis]|uniref:Biotin transporter n=1 Tax=Staphylococcus massiliensis S46 TaxID=1229783 RepID=K9ASE4_9STAP|nr:biotin transporter BioY [Staphylococcus massiliensis]EKU48961.1 BioY family protein [Staphylococcus massiliensis S46]MCG3399401.1 biotin transporter BioY [Staphylococcus massiliensis]MCG3402498.1 biotin transporter BioY [Staphylococcus massiliensis]MCG3411537.1 biotin transporter BioY [Staphylococcus massiliensis]PNZ98757.1 biotin transporter BioY [Staphylococcus massiliensis CCUG 55927]
MKTKHLVYVALMAAIIAVLGLVPPIPLPFVPVPIVLQNIGIYLAGIILGMALGPLSVLIFLLLVIVGVPLLPGGRGSIGILFGPSAGFIIMYPIVAFLIGYFREKVIKKVDFKRVFIITLTFGVLLLDIVGCIVMGIVTNLPVDKTVLACLSFLPGDIVKAIVATIIGVALHKNPQFQKLMARD